MDHNLLTGFQAKIRAKLINTNVLFNPEVKKFIECDKQLIDEGKNTQKLEQYKKSHPLWAQAIMKKYSNKTIKINNQWTTLLGEFIAENLIERVFNEKCEKIKDNHMIVDFTTKNYYFEVKTRNFYTSGTAGEKILGSPYKYCNLKDLDNKKLYIILLGFQEYEAIHNFKLFSPSGNQIKILEFYKSLNIEFIKGSDMLKH